MGLLALVTRMKSDMTHNRAGEVVVGDELRSCAVQLAQVHVETKTLSAVLSK